MKKIVVVVTLILSVMVLLAAGRAEVDATPRGVLVVLQVKDAVMLKDIGDRFDLVVFSRGPTVTGCEVIEVGPDYVVLRDISGVMEHRIPIYAIRQVSVMKVPGP